MTNSNVLSAAISAALAELRTFVKETGQATRIGNSAAKHLISAAIKSGTTVPERVAGFKAATDVMYAEIRSNTNGLARSAGAVKADTGDSYVIPGTIRSQVSQVARALKFGVDLGTEAEPIGAGEMRKRTDAAVEAAAAAEAAKNPPKELTGDDLIRQRVSNALKDASETIGALSGAELAKAAGFVAQMAVRLMNLKKGQPDAGEAAKGATDSEEAEGAAAEAVATPTPTPTPEPTPATDAVNPSGKTARVTVKGKKAARRIARAA